jgi:hypothetical protein
LACPALAASRAIPPQATGKSIVVSWSEDRVQRFYGTDGSRQVHVDFSMNVYVSTAGRIFNRISAVSTGMGRRGSRSGESEQVAGEGDRGEFAKRAARFEGRALLIDAEFPAGARHIAVSFDAGLATCTAHVINGWQAALAQS